VQNSVTNVSGETRLTVSAIAFASDRTAKKCIYPRCLTERLTAGYVPVEVSTCVNVNTLYFFDIKAFSISLWETAAPIPARN
jgi:hypothetical protein